MKRISVAALAFLLAFLLPVTASAETAKGTTLRLAAYEGTVSMTNASGKAVTPKKDLRMYSGYGLSTAVKSNAYISLDGTKAVKLDASGKASIRESGKQLEVYLLAGQLFFNVTAPLQANESLDIRSGTMVTGVRGSFGWVTATEMGLMHGHVTLTCTNPETGESRVTEVYSGEKVYFEQDTTVTAADPELLEIDFVKEIITNEDVPAIVVEEMRGDETLQEQVTRDVETVDVPALLDSLEAKQAEEAAAAEEAQQTADAAAEAQEEAIAARASVGTDYYFETPETTGASDSGDSDDSGGSYTPPAPTPTPSMVYVHKLSELPTAVLGNPLVTYTGRDDNYSDTVTKPFLSVPNGHTVYIGESGTKVEAFFSGMDNSGTVIVSSGGGTNTADATHIGFTNSGGVTISNRSGATLTFKPYSSASIPTDGSGVSFSNYGNINVESMAGFWFGGNVLLNESTGIISNSGTCYIDSTLTNYGTIINNGSFNLSAVENHGTINNNA